MPFGKYEGRYLIDLPEYYVVWYSNKGFPKEGQQLQLIYELKLNGLEELIRNIKKIPKTTINEIYTILKLKLVSDWKLKFPNYLIFKLALSQFIIVFLPSFYTTTTQTTTE
jgi:uncharacterized protein (DUF3820 family)